MMRNTTKLSIALPLVAVLSIGVSGCFEVYEGADCESDDNCIGDRICENARCVDPYRTGGADGGVDADIEADAGQEPGIQAEASIRHGDIDASIEDCSTDRERDVDDYIVIDAAVGGGSDSQATGEIPCNRGTFEGSVAIETHDDGDIQLLAGYTGIEGDLGITVIGGYFPELPLIDLGPLRCLTVIGGNAIFMIAPGLNDLDGLNNLTTIGGQLLIGMTGLTNLDGFGNLRSIGGNLRIEQNSLLPTCEAEWLRDHVGEENIGGTVTIAGNDDSGTCE